MSDRSKLKKEEVEALAMLARLHLEPDEVERLQGELKAILDHFRAIAIVDTEGVAPMTHAVPVDLPLRPDEPAPSLPVEEALRAAPKREGELFVVPAIIAGGSS